MFSCCAIATLKELFIFRGRLPFSAHIKQIHKEIICEFFWPRGEDAMLRLAVIGIQNAHPANQNCHLRRCQCQQLRLVNQQLLGGDSIFRLLVIAEAICRRLEYIEGFHIGLLR